MNSISKQKIITIIHTKFTKIVKNFQYFFQLRIKRKKKRTSHTKNKKTKKWKLKNEKTKRLYTHCDYNAHVFKNAQKKFTIARQRTWNDIRWFCKNVWAYVSQRHCMNELAFVFIVIYRTRRARQASHREHRIRFSSVGRFMKLLLLLLLLLLQRKDMDARTINSKISLRQ